MKHSRLLRRTARHRHRSRWFHFGLLALCALALSAATARAQAPERPQLPRGADANDWEAYYDLGAQALQRDPRLAANAFFWAARLDPTRSEPRFAQWVTFWRLQHESRFSSYIRGDEKVLASPDVMRADALRALAFRRNPFVHQGLFIAVVDAMPGYYCDDAETRAWIAYGKAELPQAIRGFAAVLRRGSAGSDHLRYLRAAAFVAMGAYDSASVELDGYLQRLRAREAREAGGLYESKALIEYAQGVLHSELQRQPAADEAFGRALLEDMSFAPAHIAVGRRALARGQGDVAISELMLALAIDSKDVVTRHALGDAFMQLGKTTEAAEHYRHAVEAEPYYAESHYKYAMALEAGGNTEGAAAAYARAVALGARSWRNGVKAQARLSALSAKD